MIIDDKQLRKFLKDRCKEAGSQRAWAEEHRQDETLVSKIINGDREFTDGILKALKAKRVKKYGS
jgi:hypothetical protein